MASGNLLTGLGITLLGGAFLYMKSRKAKKLLDLSLESLHSGRNDKTIITYKDGSGESFAAYEYGGLWRFMGSNEETSANVGKALTKMKLEHLAKIKDQVKVLRIN